MFSLNIFIGIFIPVFLVVASIGPCLLTYANISMSYGYKKGFIAASGCFTIDVLYISLGAFAINTVKALMPNWVMSICAIFAACFLLYLAFDFWNTNAEKLKANIVSNNSMVIYIKLLCLTLSSPIAIVGYASIFSAISNISENIVSILLGAYSGAFIAHALVVILFATIGKKINTKILILLNKISAIIISGFAISIFISAVRRLFWF